MHPPVKRVIFLTGERRKREVDGRNLSGGREAFLLVLSLFMSLLSQNGDKTGRKDKNLLFPEVLNTPGISPGINTFCSKW